MYYVNEYSYLSIPYSYRYIYQFNTDVKIYITSASQSIGRIDVHTYTRSLQMSVVSHQTTQISSVHHCCWEEQKQSEAMHRKQTWILQLSNPGRHYFQKYQQTHGNTFCPFKDLYGIGLLDCPTKQRLANQFINLEDDPRINISKTSCSIYR